jgi:TAG lipase/steryl ester hydrolase/phospholipase A2/LPA acyltransferase
VLNVSVTAADTNEPPRLLNYLTAPHVVIWSAVACSSAFPRLHHPQELLARNAAGNLVSFSSEAVGGGEGSRQWRDGSLEEDLPMRGLSEMFSVNHFIVSQTNPHIVPFLNLKRHLGTAGAVAESEFKHRWAGTL